MRGATAAQRLPQGQTVGVDLWSTKAPSGNRERALTESLRALKPGGTALIADIGRTRAYRRFLAAQPGTLMDRRVLGWRFWVGGPHLATALISVMRTRTAD